MSDTTGSGPKITPSKNIPVRLGFVLAVVAAGCAVAAVAGLPGHLPWLALLVLSLAALAGGAAGAVMGIFGVIRHGIFTEGCGTSEVRSDLRRALWARLAAAVGSVTLLGSLALTVVVVLRAAV